MKFSHRKLSLIFGMLLFFLIFDAILFFRNIREIFYNQEQISHTQLVINQVDALSLTMKENGIHLRNYLLSQDKNELELYTIGTTDLLREIKILETMVEDGGQQSVVQNLQAYFEDRIVAINETVLNQQKSFAEAAKALTSSEHVSQRNQSMVFLGQIRTAQELKLRSLEQVYETSIRTTLFTFTLISLTNFFLLIGFFALFERDLLQRQKLRLSEKRYRVLMDANMIGVAILKMNGEVVEANRTFLQMIGYSQEELQYDKKIWQKITPKKFAARELEAFKKVETSGESQQWEKELVHKDGKVVTVLVGFTKLPESKGEVVAFIVDISEIKQIEEELKQSKDQLEVILQNIADGITVQNARGELIFVNEAAAKQSGFSSPTEMLEKSKTKGFVSYLRKIEMMTENGQEFPLEKLPGRIALVEKKRAEAVMQYRLPDSDQTRWTIVKANPVFDDHGNVVYAVNVTIDITARKELEQKKEEFISIASHELKTPLTTIKGYSQLLEKHLSAVSDLKSLDYAKKINSHINKLTNLISALLDVSKIQAGKIQLDLTQFSFDDLVKEIIEDIKPMSRQHTIHLYGKTNQFVYADKVRIGQVITNILTNAMKYSPEAKKIDATLQKKKNEVILSIRDYGIGIAKDQLPKVFDKFYRAEDVSEGFSGMGVGLYICNEIIVRHQGKIWVKSQKGKGSEFFISLPIAT